MTAREEDLRLASRFVDGEFAADEARAFERRLLEDADLRAAVDELRATRAMFVSEPAPTPSGDFYERVVARVRKLPTGDELSALDEAAQTAWAGACSRLLVAATVLIGLGLLAFAGMLRATDSGRLEASPDDVRMEMERIDELIRARRGEPK